ncbi:MAG: permease [Clostridiales bacterium]|nr:permease [Clostridiales bacterium]
MSGIILYSSAIILLVISFLKDREKTKVALKKAWKSFESILPQILTVMVIVGALLAVLDTQTISRLLGSQSRWMGVVLAAVAGSIAIIPPYVAFPMAALLLREGAGYMQMGAFVSTLMMVGIVTMPVEIKYFGKRLTLLRNVFAFMFSFLVAAAIGLVVG